MSKVKRILCPFRAGKGEENKQQAINKLFIPPYRPRLQRGYNANRINLMITPILKNSEKTVTLGKDIIHMENYQTIRPSIFLSLTLLCWACVHDTKKTDSESTHLATTPVEEETSIEDNPIWEYDYEADSLVRTDSTSSNLTAKEAIQVVNGLYKDKIKLEYVKQNEDTLFVKIDSATVLTQQMGSAGARAYIALATYTLTEPQNVHVVIFDFKEGDHAYPGAYSRASFEK